jgi:hypothetical protein
VPSSFFIGCPLFSFLFFLCLTGLLCDGSMSSGLAYPTAAPVILNMDFSAAGTATLEQRILF